MELADRYWAKVDRSSPSGCWPWTGATSEAGGEGYGTVAVGGRTRKAHRVGWTLVHGPIPKGLHVLHRCDTPLCQRPDHWFLGTHQENMADRDSKGRQRSPRNTGEANPRAKLTEDEVRQIRDRCSNGETQRAVAAAYGIRQPTVSEIVSGQKWGHVE